MFLLLIIEENAPGGGVLARFYRPGVGALNSFLPGGGLFAHQKNCPGGWSGLELTDTLHRKVYRSHSVCFKAIP